MAQASCGVHTTACTYPTLSGVLFVDPDSNVAVAAAHSWRVDTTTGYQTCLIEASIDSRLLEYPKHTVSSLASMLLVKSVLILPLAGMPTTLGPRLPFSYALW